MCDAYVFFKYWQTTRTYMFICDIVSASDIRQVGGDDGGILRGRHCVDVNAAVHGNVFRQPFVAGLGSNSSTCDGGGAGRRRWLFITGFEHHCGMMIETFNEWRVGGIWTRLEVIGIFTTIALGKHIYTCEFETCLPLLFLRAATSRLRCGVRHYLLVAIRCYGNI